MASIFGLLSAEEECDVFTMQRALAHRSRDSGSVLTAGDVCIGMQNGHEGFGNKEVFPADESGSIRIAFNGRILNAPELRRKCELHNHRFSTDRDSELIIHLYEDMGTAAFEEINGGFSLAIWDGRSHQLLLARDRFGEHPLYYFRTSAGALCFACELKALLATGLVDRELSLDGLDNLLTFRCIPPPLTAFKSISALGPGECLIADSKHIKIFRYLAVKPAQPLCKDSIETSLEDCLAMINTSIRRRNNGHSDASLLLSGGIDSSVLAALMLKSGTKRLRTFTLGFDLPGGNWKYDERANARSIAGKLGTEHHEAVISGVNAKNCLPRFIWAMDQPTGDGLHHYLIYEQVSQFTDHVATGTGGDELFAGYEWFRKFGKMTQIDGFLKMLGGSGRRLVPRVFPWSRRVASVVAAYGSFLKKFGTTNILVGETEKASLLNSDVYGSICRNRSAAPLGRYEYLSGCIDQTDHINALSRILLETDLPSLLLRDADVFGHAHGLQVESPFLDPDLVNFALTVPAQYKRRGKKEKIMLRMIGSRFLPKDVTTRPKQGFFAPIGYWMRHELKSVVEDALSPETTKKRGLFDPESVWSMYRDFQRNPATPFFKVWLLTTLELWQRHFIDQPPGQSVPDPMPLFQHDQESLMNRTHA